MKSSIKNNLLKVNSNYWYWNGFKICWHVEREGNTKPLILIHGFGASSGHWRNNSTFFAERGFAVYSLDLIGFGNSAQPGIKQIGKLDNEVWSEQVKDFIKEIIRPKNSNKIILIGNSLGALVALTTAVTASNEILGIIAAPLPDPIILNPLNRKLNLFIDKIKKKFIKIFFIILPIEIILLIVAKLGIIKLGLRAAYCKKENIDIDLINLIKKPVLKKTAARSLRAMCIGMSTRSNELRSFVLIKRLNNKVPFLVLWGEKDNFIPLFLGKKIANFYRWVELKIISNSGHCIHDEDYSKFNKITYEWIKDLKTF